jgi:hypothetical protein
MAGMKGKPMSERPVWFLPLMGLLLPVGVGGIFLCIQWISWERKAQINKIAQERVAKQLEAMPKAEEPLAKPEEPLPKSEESLPEPTRYSSGSEQELPETPSPRSQVDEDLALADTTGQAGSSRSGNQDIRLMVYCENALKARLKDPNSYQRVEIVTKGNSAAMTYRSTNSFGAVVTEQALCIDADPVRILPVR